MTRRCFEIACRVTSEPAVNLAIDSGPSSHSRATSRSRVSSPRAANTSADDFAGLLLAIHDVLADRLHHQAPAIIVGGKRLRAALERNAVEAGLVDRQPHS